DEPLGMARLLRSIQVKQVPPAFDLDDLDVWKGLANLSTPLVHKLTWAEYQPSIWPTGCTYVRRRHGDDGLAHTHLANQQKRFLSFEGLASRLNDVRLGIEWITQEIQCWQRIANRDMQWIERSLGLLPQNGAVLQHVLIEVGDVLLD